MSPNPGLFSGVWNYLKKNTLLGEDNYLNTPTAAYNVLCQYKKLTTTRKLHVLPGAVMFLKVDDTSNTKVPGSDGHFFMDVACYRCQLMGNYAGNFL